MRGASLTRRVGFRARHRYHRPDWDAARNRATFGAAAELHEHDYTCDVTVGGPVDPDTGMIIDLGALDRAIDATVVQPLHGQTVNDVLEEFAPGRRIPTCEEIARVLATRLGAALSKVSATAHVRSVRVAEDDSLSGSWTVES